MATSNNNILLRVVARGRSYRRWLLRVLKYTLLLLLSYVIYRQVGEYWHSVDELSSVLYSGRGAVVLGVVMVLMAVNWALEMYKWQLLVRPFASLGLWQSARSVFAGISLALVTPARIGEYGGRLVGIPAEARGKAMLAHGVGSIAQNIHNITVGLVGMIGYGVLFLDMNYSTIVALVTITFVVLSVLLTVYFRLDLVVQLLSNYRQQPWVQRLSDQASFLSTYTYGHLSRVLAVSAIRYIVYLSQYVLLVMLCGVTQEPIYAVLGVAVIFFIQSGIPLPPMLSVLARGEMAIWVWSVFSGQVVAILCATMCLWLINLVIPALMGAVVLWSTDIE